MEFWGVEVKNGESLTVEPGDDRIVHISQAALGEVKKDKGSDSVYLYLKVNNQKFVLGTLSHEKVPQTTLDVVFDKNFELSHSWKNGSVYFTGYKVEKTEDSDISGSDYDTEEELPLVTDNGKPDAKSQQAKPEAQKADAAKSDNAVRQVNFKEPNKDVKSKQEVDDSDDDDDEDDEDDEEMASSDDSGDDQGRMVRGDNESSDDDSDEDDDSDGDESSDDETPKKPEPSKKRPAESALKTPTDKKAKLTTAQKTDGKKVGGHTATPHPAKQAGRKPVNSEQTKQLTPKSAGSHPCKSCNRLFTSETGLQAHTKAKHGAAA